MTKHDRKRQRKTRQDKTRQDNRKSREEITWEREDIDKAKTI
jgi:hypothetical protein